MRRYRFIALIALILAGCETQPKPRKSLKQHQLERFIAGCNKANPVWTPQEKLRLRHAVEIKRVLVAKAIRSDKCMHGARLVVAIVPEGIEASCTDALHVSVDGVVQSVEQKRILETICRRYSNNTVNIYSSSVGIKRRSQE